MDPELGFKTVKISEKRVQTLFIGVQIQFVGVHCINE